MKSPQARVNAQAAKRAARADALELVSFLAKGVIVLFVTASIFSIFDVVVELSEGIATTISAPASDE